MISVQVPCPIFDLFRCIARFHCMVNPIVCTSVPLPLTPTRSCSALFPSSLALFLSSSCLATCYLAFPLPLLASPPSESLLSWPPLLHNLFFLGLPSFTVSSLLASPPSQSLLSWPPLLHSLFLAVLCSYASSFLASPPSAPPSPWLPSFSDSSFLAFPPSHPLPSRLPLIFSLFLLGLLSVCSSSFLASYPSQPLPSRSSLLLSLFHLGLLSFSASCHFVPLPSRPPLLLSFFRLGLPPFSALLASQPSSPLPSGPPFFLSDLLFYVVVSPPPSSAFSVFSWSSLSSFVASWPCRFFLPFRPPLFYFDLLFSLVVPTSFSVLVYFSALFLSSSLSVSHRWLPLLVSAARR